MRIISGSYKGRKIIAPKKLPVRPTTDFAKEGLFNIINNRYRFNEISVLDLFSGTGNISFEFASRGVKSIVSVDAHQACIRFIDKISSELDLPISTIKIDVFKFLSGSQYSYDIIFADPPYNFEQEQFISIVDKVIGNDMLNEGGCLILEHSKHTQVSDHDNHFESRRYGGSVFSFFRKK